MSLLRLRVDALAKGGEAVARAEDGRVVFIDGAAPGDLVDVELTEQKARFARGRVSAVLEAGAARVEPPCAHANRCGGCPWQIIASSVQHEAKHEIVARALRKLEVPLDALIAAPAPLGYRGRATLYARGGVIGFHARRSHELVPIDRCLALEPGLDRVLASVRAEAELGIALGEEGVLRATIAPSGAVQLALSPGRGADLVRLDTIAERLVQGGLVVGVLREGRAPFGEARLDAGEGGRPFWVSAAGFRQANHAQNLVLRGLVDEALGADGQRLVELYAGDGNFTRDQVGRARHLLAIEEDPAAIARLRQSLPTVEAVGARVETELRHRAVRGERFERVLLDPPRAGAKDAIAAILEIGPARIVYVSCDPATLARDLEALVTGGYRATRATPIDLMPHTDHVEVVATLERS